MDVNTQLAHLLYKYLKKRKIADEIFCKEAIKILIEGWNLEEYVKSNIVIPYKSESNGSFYSPKIKMIIIYLDNILNMFKSKDYIFDKIFKNKKLSHNKIAIINLTVLQTILHEIEHAKQEKIYKIDNPKSVHDILVQSSNINVIDKKNNIDKQKQEIVFKMLKSEYDKFELFYDCLPIERFAEIKSYNRLIAINSNTNDNYYINEYLNYMKMIALSRVYVNCDKSPLEKFIDIKENIINNIIYNYREDSIREIIASSKYYNWELKLLYGLPVNKEDWNKLKNEFENNLAAKIRMNKFVRYMK